MTATVRRRVGRVVPALVMLLLTGLFVALGLWQVERRAWKHGLIAAVDSRTRAAPVDAPGRAQWPRITAEHDAYRPIRATGRYIAGRRILVRAVSDLGAGYWVIEPLDTGAFTLLVNRGFIGQDRRDTAMPVPAAKVMVTGLLRITEPEGAFLRANDPTSDRWYSRDVATMARARGLSHVAPYFLDADASANGAGQPVGGLTVIRFSDNHLVYALTWFAMAGLTLWAFWHLMLRRRQGDERPYPS